MIPKHLEESIAYLKEKGFDRPEVGIVLGTGLGQLVNHLEEPVEAHYNQIPFFPLATVEFHSGKLLFGTLGGKKVVVMQGRFHIYEGYDLQDVTYPVRVMHGLGIKHLLISNASGAINLNYKKGEMMLIEDHLNLQGGSPLAFKNVGDFGERFADMSAPYDPSMSKIIKEIATEENIPLQEGVYAAVV
ncbi:MAG: purine-nucleoside phosphorylase, partial [Flavobacteriaceae bacterium]|nr:purine-nucleoside phosphorylase [Flavobacteriaceae bacterium]